MSETTALIHRLQRAGLTQTAISARTGIPQPRLSRWAAGETPIGADDALRLKALADQLGASPVPTETVEVRDAA